MLLDQRKIFNEWIDTYRALLFKVVRAYTYDQDDSNDLFQEIAIQVWRSIPNFKNESAVSTWLYRIALNTAMRWSKKERGRTNKNQELDSSSHLLEYKEEAVDERLEWLYDQIAKMNEIDKSLTLLLLDDYSYKEISEIMGISESNVGVKIHRIKKYLTEKTKSYDSYEV